MPTTRTTTATREHYINHLEHVVTMVGLEDLTTTELATLAALFEPIYTRVLAGNRAPALRLALDDDGTDPCP